MTLPSGSYVIHAVNPFDWKKALCGAPFPAVALEGVTCPACLRRQQARKRIGLPVKRARR